MKIYTKFIAFEIDNRLIWKNDIVQIFPKLRLAFRLVRSYVGHQQHLTLSK